MVTLCFDDGYQAVFNQVLPLLRRHVMRAVFAIPLNTAALETTEKSPVVPLEDWKLACAADGHELAAHGVTHSALTTLSDAELASELTRAQEATDARTLIYPGGAHDARVTAAARQYYRGARTVLPGFETLPPRAAYRLRSLVATGQNFQVWKWNLRALWAVITNRWLIETFHDVSPTGNRPTAAVSRHTIPLPALEAHLKFLKRLPLRIATIREVMHA